MGKVASKIIQKLNCSLNPKITEMVLSGKSILSDIFVGLCIGKSGRHVGKGRGAGRRMVGRCWDRKGKGED